MAIPTQILKTIFQIRRDTAEMWKKVNPVLMLGEPGYDITTDRLKIGDGVTPWNDLPWISGIMDGDTVIINCGDSKEVM